MLPFVALIALAGFTSRTAPASLAAQQKKYGDWKTLYELAAAIEKDYMLPGMCVGYQHLGEAQNVAVSGTRSTDHTSGSLQDEDRLLVGSIGQAMTATLVARLIDLKKLYWKTTIGEVLTNIKMADAYKSVTIEQLIHHTANLPPDLQMSYEELDQLAGSAESPTELRKAYVTKLLSSDRVPGQKPSTNSEYVVAGYLVEKLINQPYEWLMNRYVFEPMSLSTAMIAPVGSQDQVGSQNNPYGHLYGDFGYAPYVMPITRLDWMMAPAGFGVSCSVGDLVKFASYHLRALNGDPQILTADSYKRLHTLLAGQTNSKQAGGWFISDASASESSLSRTGENGTFYADVTLWPERDLVVVAITNAGIQRQPSPTMVATLAIRDRFEKKK